MFQTELQSLSIAAGQLVSNDWDFERLEISPELATDMFKENRYCTFDAYSLLLFINSFYCIIIICFLFPCDVFIIMLLSWTIYAWSIIV